MLKPSPALTNWFCNTYKTTPQHFEQHYGALAHELAHHGHDIRGTSDTDIAAVISHEAGKRGIQHLAMGGNVQPGDSAVVGDQPGNPNAAPEVITNPAGNAPVQVQSNPNTGGGNTQAIVVGQALGLSPQAVLAAYSPEQINAAYAKFSAQQTAPGVDFGNKVAQLGAAAATYGDHDALKNEYAQEQTERGNRMADTVGQTLQVGKSLGEGLDAATKAQGIQKGEFDIAAMTATADPTSAISSSVRDLLTKYGVKVTPGVSAAQADYLTKTNGELNKQVTDLITANAAKTTAGAKATEAGTGEQKETFLEGAYNNGSKKPGTETTIEGGNVNVKPAPGEVTGQNDWATSVAKSRDSQPAIDKSITIVGNTLNNSMGLRNSDFGKFSVSQVGSNLTNQGPSYGLEQQFNALKTLNLANTVSTVGGASELRVAGVDTAAMSQAPTTKEGKEVAVSKQLRMLDSTIRAGHVITDKMQYNQTNPSDNGSKFNPDYSGKVSVWNPDTNATALVDRAQVKNAEGKGFVNVSDGYGKFLAAYSRVKGSKVGQQ